MNNQLGSLYKQIKEGKIGHEEAAEQLKLLAQGGHETTFPSIYDEMVPEVYVYDEPYLKDHIVFGNQVLIGATHGSLAMNTFFKLFPQENCVNLHMLNFISPIQVENHQQVEVLIKPVHCGGKVDFNAEYWDRLSGSWKISAAGNLQRFIMKRKTANIEGIRDTMVEVEDLEKIYSYHPDIRLGDSFRTITQLFGGGDQVLARVDLSPASQEEKHDYVLHPLILNSAFMAVFPLLEQTADKDIFLPFGIKDIYFSKTSKLDKCWVLVKLVRNSGEMVTFDADVIDDDFQIVANCCGCSIKRLRTGEPEKQRHAAASSHSIVKPDTEELSQKVKKYLISKLSKMVDDPSKLLNQSQNLMDMGLGSSQLMELTNEIQAETNIELNPTLFFEYPNISELAGFFYREHSDYFMQSNEVYEDQVAAYKPDDQKPDIVKSETRKRVLSGKDLGLNEGKPRENSQQEPLNGDVAVIGIHGMFAGASNLDGFWGNLRDRKDLITEIPADHWDYRPWYDKNQGAKDKTYCKWGSFIDDVDKFDAEFFNISPREADWMDPQLRLLLQSIYAAGEDAGYINRLRGTDTGVFVGVCSHDYGDRISELNLPVEPYVGTGNAQTVIANRISFLFNLKGPSVTMDTACSSSLFALHYACLALQNKECSMAFVGGANLLLSSWHYRYFSSISALSPTGRCHSFDAAADGYIPGEGIGSILIKPLQQAKRDGDRIYAVIKGSAALHGGYTPSLTAPSVEGEENVILKAWEAAGIQPETISYIEAHGTGTKLGDPIEINSLKKAFKRFTEKEHFCAVGSVKSSIGHTEGAAGIAGILKVIMQMKYRQIPAMTCFKELNPYIRLDESALYINRETEEWKSEDGVPRRAGISSFGFSGSYAHVVLEEYIADDAELTNPITNVDRPALIVLSAKNEERLQEVAQRLLAAMVELKLPDSRLADMAYTLQVGRETMEERLAVLARSVPDLEEKLKAFLAGRKDVPDLCRGSAKNNTVDKYMEKPEKTFICEGKYTEIMEFWAKGMQVDWNELYSDQKPHLMSLPSYPFEKNRYWLPESSKSGGSPAVNTIHPLLHKNTSDFYTQRFSSTFTGEEFFLADHIVRNRKVLPGVAYLEIARAAVEQAADYADETRRIRLKNVAWIKPAALHDKTMEIHIELYPEENGEIAYKIFSRYQPDREIETIHSQGRAEAVKDVEIPSLNIADLRRQCNERIISSLQCYEMYQSVGIGYGPGYMGIDEMYVGQGQVLAKLSLPSSVLGTKEQFVLHPSLIDAALQATIGIVAGEIGENPSLPFAMQELEIFSSCTAEMWALVRSNNGENNSLHKFDVDICDNEGNVCIRIKGFSTRVLERGIENISEHVESLILEPFWEEQGTNYEKKDYTRQLIILCELDKEIEKNIQQQTDTENGECLCLNTTSGQMNIGERFEKYTTVVLEAIQNILGDKDSGEVSIQMVVPFDKEKHMFTGLLGLLKTARLENPRIIVQLIEVEANESAEGIMQKFKENRANPSDDHIRYYEGKRWVVGRREITTVKDKTVVPWKHQGTYLITGGTGGLGFLLAGDIAKKVRGTRIILTGRSELNEAKLAQLNELQALSTKVEYRKADVTKKEEVSSLINDIIKDFGSLNGIIHCSGIIRDSFIIKKNNQQLQEVLAPKVSGLVNLDQASKDLNLDFFILFSSISGSMGSVGQGDYAAANAFMDAYAGYRNSLAALNQRKGHTLSINWPLWKDGGMQVGEEREKLLREGMGMTPMQTETGINVLYNGLAMGLDNIMVLEGDVKRLRRMLLDKKPVDIIEKKASTEKVTIVHERENELLQQKAITYFKKQLSSTLRMPVNKIEADAPLEKYGIDSLMVMEMTDKLEKTFGSLPKTLFFEYQNIHALTDYFIRFYRNQLINLVGISEKKDPVKIQEDSLFGSDDVKTVMRGQRHTRFSFSDNGPKREKASSALDIAIVGVSGRYPGAGNVREFWEVLKSGMDCITEIPEDRWDHSLYFDEDRNKPGKTYSKWGGFLDGIDRFDPMFFNISPREALILDPQERLFLQCVYETLEDAGYTREALGFYKENGLEGNVGVFVGAMYEEYQLYGAQEQVLGRPIALSGSQSSIANRVSYFCNFHGPSIALDTMCSSSLTAIYLACQNIQSGGCELAIAGGVNLSIHPNKYLFLGQSKLVSSKGRCESFGMGGNGYVPGEGVGAVLLKPLSKAVEDGDNIYGVIKSAAINHGGKTNGYSVPNPNAQSELIRRAIKQAGVEPRAISYIETHGTGTSLGDPIEIAGLKKAFEQHTEDKQFCSIGSVKSNIGHCESAAGIAGLTKILLQLKHAKLVPSLHSKVLNPNIDFLDSPFVVQQELEEWKRPVITINGETREYPRIAGISSFGAGGSNAHLIIEEYIPANSEDTRNTDSYNKPAIFVLSAKNEKSLMERVQRLLPVIEEYEQVSMLDMAYTLQVGREAMEERLAVTAETIVEFRKKLKAFMEGQEDVEGLYRGQVKRNKEAIDIFAGDEDVYGLIDAWIVKGKYGKIAELWAKGINFDWNKLYGETAPHRISLPTYPFTKERYWAPSLDIKEAVTMHQPSTKVQDPKPKKEEKFESNKGISPVPAMDNKNSNGKPGLTVKLLNPQLDIQKPSYGDIPQKPERIPLRLLADKEHIEAKTVSQPSKPVLMPLEAYLPPLTEISADTAVENVPFQQAAITRETLYKELVESLAQALYMKPEDIDVDAKFVDMGMDSISGVNWVQAINNQYGLSIPSTKVYDYPSVREISGYLQNELNKRPLSKPDSFVESISNGTSVHTALVDTDSQQIEVLKTEHTAVSGLSKLQTDSIAAVEGTFGSNVKPETLQKELSLSLAEVLYMNPGDVDADAKFIDMGMDSISGVNWVQAVSNQYGLLIPSTRVYDYPSIREFSRYLQTELNKKIITNVDSSMHSVQDEAPLNILQLSEISETGIPSFTEILKQESAEPVMGGSATVAYVNTEELQQELVESLAQVLYMNPGNIDEDAKFIDMGMDSISGVNWVQVINSQYGLSIPSTRVYDYPSIVEFTAYLKKELVSRGTNLNQLALPTQNLSLEEVLDKVSKKVLSIEDAEKLLNKYSNSEV